MFLPNHPAYFLCMVASSSGSYANTLMAVLNSRVKYNVNNQSTQWTAGQSDIEFSPPRSGPGNPFRSRAATRILRPSQVLLTVSQEIHTTSDDLNFQLNEVKQERVSDLC